MNWIFFHDRIFIPFGQWRKAPLFRHEQKLPRQSGNAPLHFKTLANQGKLALLPSLWLEPSDAIQCTYRFIITDNYEQASYSAWIGKHSELPTEIGSGRAISLIDYFELQGSFKIQVEFYGTQPHSFALSISLRKWPCSSPSPKTIPEKFMGFAPKSQACQYHIDPNIGHRICSPVSTAMLLDLPKVSFLKIAHSIYHKHHHAFGIWPQALLFAQKQKRMAQLTWLKSEDEIIAALKIFGKIGTSIQANPGELKHFPLPQGTQGHLCVVYGIDDTQIHCADPAQNTNDQTLISYNKEEFLACFFRRGGLAYLF